MYEHHPLLELRGVSKTYRAGGLLSRKRIPAVRQVSITMPKGPTILAVVGESGSGKSTLAKMILRQERPSGGSIMLDGAPIHVERGARISNHDLRTRVQAIAQSPFDAFSSHLTVDFYLRRTAINLLGLRGHDAVQDAVDRALQSVGLTLHRIAGKYLHQFSGGELQRISIARALIPKPILIVADEPVSMVDASVRMNIINLFRDIMARSGVSFLYITHDLATAFYLADDLIIMQSGEIVERGKPASIMADPAHSYTRLLISSIPRVGAKWEELSA